MPEMSKPVYFLPGTLVFRYVRGGTVLGDAPERKKSFDAQIMPLPLGDLSRMGSGAPGKAAFGRALSVDTRDYSF